MSWQKPEFIELCMNAEIGAYQEDTGDERDQPPVLAPAPRDQAAAQRPNHDPSGARRVA